jgi:hypothetical protein
MPPITTATIHIHSTGHPGFLSCQGLVLLLALPNNLMLSKLDLDDDDGTHSDVSRGGSLNMDGEGVGEW